MENKITGKGFTPRADATDYVTFVLATYNEETDPGATNFTLVKIERRIAQGIGQEIATAAFDPANKTVLAIIGERLAVLHSVDEADIAELRALVAQMKVAEIQE